MPLQDVRVVDRFPAGFRYVAGLRAHRRRAGRADRRGPRARLERPQLSGRRPAHCGAAARRRRWRQRRRVRQSRAGHATPDGQRRCRARPPRRCASCRTRPSTAPTSPARCSTTPIATACRTRASTGLPGVRLVDRARPARAHGPLRPLPHHLRGHAARGPRQQLRAEARRPHAAERLSRRRRISCQVSARRAARRCEFNFGASIHACVGLDLADAVFEPGTTEMRLQWRPRMELLLDGAAQGAGRAAPVVPGRCRGCAARATAPEGGEAANPGRVEGGPNGWRHQLCARDRAGSVLATRRADEAGDAQERTGDPYAETQILLAGVRAAGVARRSCAVRRTGADRRSRRAAAAERIEPFTQWVRDRNRSRPMRAISSRSEMVARERLETVKLTNVVPPIHFESGVAEIPERHVDDAARGARQACADRHNVRLHLVGHADDQPLSGALAQTFGDNAGLSRERAGEVAEFLQQALLLPPDAVSYEWAGDTQAGRVERHEPGPRAESSRGSRGLVRRARRCTSPKRKCSFRRTFKQVKVCRVADAVQDALQGGADAPRAREESRAAAALSAMRPRRCLPTSSSTSTRRSTI